MNALEFIENLLEKKRGEVMSDVRNKNVVLVMSGGLDSTVAADVLMGDYGCGVFPLFIDRGQTNISRELAALRRISGFYFGRYPGMFQKPEKIELPIPPPEIKDGLQEYKLAHGHPMRDSTILNAGVQYAASLGKGVKTVLNASIIGDDATSFAHNSLVALRAQMLNTCQHMDDWDWTVSSIWVDPLLEGIKDKSKVIAEGVRRGLPLKDTWTCWRAGEEHCGECGTCLNRKKGFEKAGCDDPTEYL